MKIFKKLIILTAISGINFMAFAGPYYTGNAGNGIRIAVPTPVLNSSSQEDNWIPQLFQDLLTSDLSTFSKMTVLDRKNEGLVRAEQRLSENAAYSEENAIEVGKLTQAAYVCVGNILNTGSTYKVTFRINNLETNEIMSSFSGSYSLRDIESSYAEKECIKVLLNGMGVELTDEGNAELSKIKSAKAAATANLAKAVAAEKKSKNIVEAIAYYTEALDNDSSITEAADHLQKLQENVASGNLREDIKNELARRKEWIKTFKDLNEYINKNAVTFIYDSNSYTSKVDYQKETVDLTFTTAKVIYNKNIIDLVEKMYNGIFATGRYDEWGKENFYIYGDEYTLNISLLDENKNVISKTSLSFRNEAATIAESNIDDYEMISLLEESLKNSSPSYKIQIRNAIQEYKNNIKYKRKLLDEPERLNKSFSFVNIPYEKITDTLSIKIDSVIVREQNKPNAIRIYTLVDWLNYQDEINSSKADNKNNRKKSR